jgi:hypothetical protein
VELQPAKRFEWERIVRRARLGKATKLVAMVLASYADASGGNVRPGEERMAGACEMGASTVRRHVAALVEAGLLERVSNGGGPRKWAACYRLVVPDDLLWRVPMLGPDEVTPLTQVSGVPLWTDPVDEQNSAHLGERSSGPDPGADSPNSAHFGGELRSLSSRTPLTQVSAHHPRPTKDQPPTDTPVSPPRDARRVEERSIHVVPAPAGWRTRTELTS